MTKRGILPFDSEHLTSVERETDRALKHETCINCGHLVKQRSGTRVCEKDLDMLPILRGDAFCDYFWKVRD